MTSVFRSGAVLVLALAGALSAAAGKDDPVNLLRLSSAKVESATSPGDVSSLAPLTDGDPKTVAEVAATEASPLDVTFSFGGGVVAPEGVRVTLPEGGASGSAAARVEILVSTVSAHSGFRSLRADPLDAAGKPKTFEFPPTAAKWILVRLVPAPGSRKVAAAEVEVLGREGEPQSRYAFAESPAKAFDVLRRLEKTTSMKLAVTEDEKAMFAKATAGRLSPVEFAEAALLASGVLDAAKRKDYLRRLDALEQQARAAVAGARTPAEKGDLLLEWLHKVPMAKGYVAQQTDLSVIFDTGTFNCVSSATLYNALALRMGMDVRAIEVPDHAFSIFYEGTRHMDVETTTAKGFNPARDKAAVERFEKMTGFRYIPDAHRDQRREVEEAGLAAIIYYNHGVMLSNEKRYHEALMANFRAMSLDAEFDSAVKNALAVLANWGVELSRGGKFQEALDVVATGLALAPKDASLVNNHRAIWSQWALSAIDAGKAGEALAILKRAQAAVPDGGFGGMQAMVYTRPADERMRAGRWEEALAAAAPGVEALDAGPREELAKWLGYFAQEWSKAVAEKEGGARALEVLRTLASRFPGNEHVTSAASNHVRRMAYSLAGAGKFEEALVAIAGARDLMTQPEDVRDVSLYVYDNWAKRHMKDSAWEKAADVYVKALAAYPEERLLKGNVAYLAQEWSSAAYAKGGATAAQAATQAMAARFPGIEGVTKSGANPLRREVHDRVEKGRYEEALATLDEGKALLEGADDAEGIYLFVFDSWAKSHMAAKAWAKAADVYAKALARFPEAGLLKGNVAYLGQEWTKAAYAEGGAAAAAEATKAMAARFPGMEAVSKSGGNELRRTVSDRVGEEKFEEALAALDQGKSLLDDADAEQTYLYVFDSWAKKHMGAEEWEAAADVYVKALARYPEAGLLKGNVAYLGQEWAKAAYAKGGAPAAAAVAKALAAKFPGVESLAQAGGRELSRTVYDLLGAEKYEEALAALDHGKDLLPGADEAQDLYFAVYDGWAKGEKKDGRWDKAAGVYAAGLARFPEIEKLKGNVGWLAQEWAKEASSKDGADKAADVLRALLKMFPGLESVARSAKNHVNNTVNALVGAGKHEEALAILERTKDLAGGEDDVRRLAVYAFDRWAKTFMDKKNWDGAIAIYDKGLARYPEQSLFKQNRTYCVEQKGK